VPVFGILRISRSIVARFTQYCCLKFLGFGIFKKRRWNVELNFTALENALIMLGQRLARSKQHYEVVAIGGASLVLLGYIDRSTKDLDLVAVMEAGRLVSAKPLPQGLFKEIALVGAALEIGEYWVNGEPTSLLEAGLPDGFEERLVVRRYDGLTVHFSGRLDQICFKLYAAVDQGPVSKHFSDLKRLEPTEKELLIAKKWCLTQDVSLEFSILLTQALSALGVEHGNSE
jgi:Nucleotidyltransferase of unknown function (DUF6036)